jgi:hypothetical protein
MSTMLNSTLAGRWVSVARETLEEGMVSWIGRRYAPRLRVCAREHPVDADGQVLVPETIYRVFSRGHVVSEHVTELQPHEMRSPQLPIDEELVEPRRALHAPEMRGDARAIQAFADPVDTLHEQTAATREMLGHAEARP